jgi:hypothetical protein
MPTNRWVDKTQPQTLMMATILMYVNAAFGIIGGTAFVFPLGTLLTIGPVAAGFGIANEKKWGWWLGVVLTALEVAYIVLIVAGVFGLQIGVLINLLIYGALLALLLHPQSREYKRVWFR